METGKGQWLVFFLGILDIISEKNDIGSFVSVLKLIFIAG